MWVDFTWFPTWPSVHITWDIHDMPVSKFCSVKFKKKKENKKFSSWKKVARKHHERHADDICSTKLYDIERKGFLDDRREEKPGRSKLCSGYYLVSSRCPANLMCDIFIGRCLCLAKINAIMKRMFTCKLLLKQNISLWIQQSDTCVYDVAVNHLIRWCMSFREHWNLEKVDMCGQLLRKS